MYYPPAPISFKELLDRAQKSREESFSVNLNLDTPLTSEQASILVKALNNNPHIKYLSLVNLWIDRERIDRQRRPEDRDHGIIAIAKMLKNNETIIRFSAARLLPEEVAAIAAALESNQSIKDIELHGIQLDDASCVALTNALLINKTLLSLRLCGTDLSGEKGVAVIKALEKNKGLEYIDLESTRVSNDAGLALANVLTINRTLTGIKLDHTHFDKEVNFAIAKALRSNRVFRSFSSRTTGIDNEIALAFIEALRVNANFTYLNMDHNFDIKREIIYVIEGLMSRNTEIMMMRKRIRQLFPNERLVTKTSRFQDTSDKSKVPDQSSDQSSESKEATEVDELDSIKRSEAAILEDISLLSSKGFPSLLIKELQDELTIACCSWDNYYDFDTRLKYLMDIINRDSELKGKALSCLAEMYSTKGVERSRTDKKAEAVRCFHLAFTAAQHGEDNAMKNDLLCQAVSFLFDKYKPSDNLQDLLQDLSREHPDRYQALKTGYQNQCKLFNVTPVDIFNAPRKVITHDYKTPAEKADRGDSKTLADRADRGDSKTMAESSILGSLNEDEQEPEAAPKPMDKGKQKP